MRQVRLAGTAGRLHVAGVQLILGRLAQRLQTESAPCSAAPDQVSGHAVKAEMEVRAPVKLSVSSCLRPALSIRVAAMTVPSTLMAPTAALASAPDVIPACTHAHARAGQDREPYLSSQAGLIRAARAPGEG